MYRARTWFGVGGNQQGPTDPILLHGVSPYVRSLFRFGVVSCELLQTRCTRDEMVVICLNNNLPVLPNSSRFQMCQAVMELWKGKMAAQLQGFQDPLCFLCSGCDSKRNLLFLKNACRHVFCETCITNNIAHMKLYCVICKEYKEAQFSRLE